MRWLSPCTRRNKNDFNLMIFCKLIEFFIPIGFSVLLHTFTPRLVMILSDSRGTAKIDLNSSLIDCQRIHEFSERQWVKNEAKCLRIKFVAKTKIKSKRRQFWYVPQRMHGMSGVAIFFQLCASIACTASLNNDKYFLIRRIARITASDAARFSCITSYFDFDPCPGATRKLLLF